MPEQRHGARGDASPLVLPTLFGITNAQARDVGAAAVVERRGQSITQAEWVYSPIAPGSAKLVTNRSEPDSEYTHSACVILCLPGVPQRQRRLRHEPVRS